MSHVFRCILVNTNRLGVVFDAMERTLSAHVLAICGQHGGGDLLQRHATASNGITQLLRLIDGVHHVGALVQIHHIRPLGVSCRREERGFRLLNQQTHES